MSKVKFKIIDGGKAIPIGKNLYKLIGRSHEEGGIITELKDGNTKTVIEAERNEIYEPKTHEFRVFSNSIKIGNKTPAQLAEAGYNPDIIFKAQQNINGNYGGNYAKDGTEENIPDIVKKQKEWLKNWYAVRLPLLGKEHLQQHVDKGLNTRYIGENEISEKDKKDFIAKHILAAYIPGIKSIHISTLHKRDKKDPNKKIIISRTKEYKDYIQPVIKSISDKGTTPLHEYSHAVSFDYGNNHVESFIPDFINNDKLNKGSNKYYSKDEEKYARIQELRYINNLDPNKTNYTKKDLKKFKNDTSKRLIEELKLGGMDKKDIINALNTWASNTNDNKTDNIAYAKNGARIKYDRGGISWLIDKLFGDENNEIEIKKKPAEGKPINEREVRLRQAYAESRFDSKAGSHAGARGLFQIMPSLLIDYNNAHGTNYTVDDLYNDEINTSIRDWKMGLNLSSEWANKNAAPDSVVYAKSLGGYNMGNQNFLDTLGVAKNLGVDIYNTLDWVDKKYLPVETVDYINFVLRNQDNSAFRNQATYEASKKLNKNKVDILNNNFQNGGQINMKLKHRNRQDITDMVMNEILPHSTGKRKKFEGGGVWGASDWSLAGNLGLNALNALTQGILGSIFENKVIDMYTKAKSKLKKTFAPVAREHIDTRVDIENELSGIKQSTAKLIENAKANTSNAKVARSQALNAIKQQNELEHRAYTNKYKEESDRRNLAAELATRYNIIDNQNYIQSEREYQDKMLQLDLGIANAEISKGQTWGNAASSALKASADTLTDYATMTNDLLKSNNPAAYAEYMRRNYGRILNPDGTLKDKYKGNKRIEDFYNKTLKPLFGSNVSTSTIIPYDGGLLT